MPTPPRRPDPPPGKVLIEAARIVTLDPAQPEATALAVAGGRVVGAGRREDFDTWRDADTRVVRVAQGAVYPGFVESHAHLMAMGRQMERLYVGSPPCRSVADVLARVRDAAARTPPGEWIVGMHYDDTLLEERRPPTAAELNAAAPAHPVYLSHMSGHLAVASEMALARAAVTEATDVPGVMRDGAGRLTGELREAAAMHLVSRLLPKAGRADRVRWLERASAWCLARGVTSMCDSNFGSADADDTAVSWQAYLEADDARTLLVRTQVFPSLAARAHLPQSRDQGFVSVGPVKLFADGSIQGHTGALRDGYFDQPEERGRLFWQQCELVETLATLRAEGRQVATHANGDAAIDLVLDAYEAALGEGRAADHRWRIEHAQMARLDQVRRMADLGVLPSFFLNHVEVFGDRHRDLFLGPERAANISPARWAQGLGVVFSLHSDAPVTPPEPLRSIATAVSRRTSSGAVLGPDQAVDPDVALRAYTSWAAWLGRCEAAVGSLKPGAWADAVVLDRALDAGSGVEERWVTGVLQHGVPVDVVSLPS